MIQRTLVIAWCLLSSVCRADDIVQQRIEAGPNDVVVLVMPALKPEASVRWLVVSPEFLTWKQMLTMEQEPACVFSMGSLKSARVYGDAVDIVDGKILRTTIQFSVVSPGPPPEPGPGPGPGPGPNPPPGPVAEFRVLILEETADRGKLPPSQLNALLSTRVRSYLMAKTPKGLDGKTPEWRVWDDDLDATQLVHVGEYWQKSFFRAKAASGGKVPWVDVSGGTGSFPLPANEDEFLSRLKVFGGE